MRTEIDSSQAAADEDGEGELDLGLFFISCSYSSCEIGEFSFVNRLFLYQPVRGGRSQFYFVAGRVIPNTSTGVRSSAVTRACWSMHSWT